MNRPTFIYPHYLATASVTATDTFTGYAAADVLEGCEDTGWRPANVTGSKSLIIDLGASIPVGQVAILGNYLNGVTLEVRGSTDGFVSSNVSLSAAAAINSSAFITAWRSWASGSYRQIKLIFSGMGASFEVNHVAVCRAVTLPWLDDGHDADVFQSEGTHLVGPSGVYLGATQQRCMRSINLDFGQLLSSEYLPFQLWAESCVQVMRPFFYVPDIDQPVCHFVWVDAKYKFSAPMKHGVRKLAPVPITARVA